jgi:hypothetical protein
MATDQPHYMSTTEFTEKMTTDQAAAIAAIPTIAAGKNWGSRSVAIWHDITNGVSDPALRTVTAGYTIVATWAVPEAYGADDATHIFIDGRPHRQARYTTTDQAEAASVFAQWRQDVMRDKQQPRKVA